MKVLAICFLAFVAAVQGRSTGLENVPAAGLSTAQSPWVVHLRIAYSNNGGRLNSCMGSLINNRYVLSASSCLQSARFAWIRYGASNVIRPELVTETSTFRTESSRRVGLVVINRGVEFTPTISAVRRATLSDELPESAILCGYGAGENNSPGENLSCAEWNLEATDNTSFEGISASARVTEYDLGAPLVRNGVQFGVLIDFSSDGASAVFVNPAEYSAWIRDNMV